MLAILTAPVRGSNRDRISSPDTRQLRRATFHTWSHLACDICFFLAIPSPMALDVRRSASWLAQAQEYSSTSSNHPTTQMRPPRIELYYK